MSVALSQEQLKVLGYLCDNPSRWIGPIEIGRTVGNRRKSKTAYVWAGSILNSLTEAGLAEINGMGKYTITERGNQYRGNL